MNPPEHQLREWVRKLGRETVLLACLEGLSETEQAVLFGTFLPEEEKPQGKFLLAMQPLPAALVQALTGDLLDLTGRMASLRIRPQQWNAPDGSSLAVEISARTAGAMGATEAKFSEQVRYRNAHSGMAEATVDELKAELARRRWNKRRA